MIKTLDLLNFKIHENKKLNFDQKLIVLYGNNGKGKTSILESLSLFTAGKGIFSLNNDDLITTNKTFFSLQIETEDAKFQVKYQGKKKETSINNTATTSSSFLDHISILGLTPYSSLAFWQDNSIKRKIINRIILQNNVSYGSFYNQYNKALKHRNSLIANNTFNSKWSSILDPIIKKNGLKINQIRAKTIEKMIKNTPKSIKNFIKNDLSLLIYPSFDEQQQILTHELPLNFIGPHLSKFTLTTDINDLKLSTGQQRKLLLSFILINLSLNQKSNNLLLLDDVLSNLDPETIYELLDILNEQNVQTLITHISKINHPHVSNIELL